MAGVLHRIARRPSAGGCPGLVPLVMLALMLGAGLVLSLTAWSRNALRWADRLEREIGARAVLSSALAEATQAIMLGSRDGATPGLEWLADDPERLERWTAPLRETRRLAAENGLACEVCARARIEKVVRPAGEPAWWHGWTGRLVVTARVEVARPTRFTLEGEQQRDVRATSPDPLPAVDRPGFFAWDAPGEGEPVLPLATRPERWLARATLRVDPDASGEVDPGYERLRQRLNGLDGVVWVGNDDRHPLTLRRAVHRGRATVVVAGALEVRDLRVEDPDRDRLTLVALSDVTLAGRVEASVVMTHPAGGAPGRRVFDSTAVIRGSVVVASGTYEAQSEIDVEPVARPASTLTVCVSPWVALDRVVVR